MKKLLKRILSQNGESLIETLVAIMIIALSTVILVTAISASSKTNSIVRASDDKFDVELSVAERGQGTIEDDLVIKGDVAFGDNFVYEYKVNYAGDDGFLRSYDKQEVSPP